MLEQNIYKEEVTVIPVVNSHKRTINTRTPNVLVGSDFSQQERSTSFIKFLFTR